MLLSNKLMSSSCFDSTMIPSQPCAIHMMMVRPSHSFHPMIQSRFDSTMKPGTRLLEAVQKMNALKKLWSDVFIDLIYAPDRFL